MCLRGAQLHYRPVPYQQFLKLKVSCSLVPNLNSAPLSELKVLPGLGTTRARSILENRQFLPFDLTPSRLSLIDGVGLHNAVLLSDWFESQSNNSATLKYGYERGPSDPCAN